MSTVSNPYQHIKQFWSIEVGKAPNAVIPTGGEVEFTFKGPISHLRIKTTEKLFVSDQAGRSGVVGQGGNEGEGWSRLIWEAGSREELPWGRGKSVWVRYADPSTVAGTGTIVIEGRSQ